MNRRWLELAHARRRGQRDTFETRRKRAETRERRTAGIGPFGSSPYEEQLALFLMLMNVAHTPQAAFGPYNVDFLLTDGIHPVAVEVHGGSKDPRKRRSRVEYLIAGPGLSVVEIFVGKWCGQPRVTIAAADQVARFHARLQTKALEAAFVAVGTAARRGVDVAGAEEPFAEHLMLWGDGTLRPGLAYPFLAV